MLQKERNRVGVVNDNPRARMLMTSRMRKRAYSDFRSLRNSSARLNEFALMRSKTILHVIAMLCIPR